MKYAFGILLAVACVGSARIPNRAQSSLDTIIIPEVDFRNADLVEGR